MSAKEVKTIHNINVNRRRSDHLLIVDGLHMNITYSPHGMELVQCLEQEFESLYRALLQD